MITPDKLNEQITEALDKVYEDIQQARIKHYHEFMQTKLPQEDKQMATLGEEAKAFVPKQTRNIADLPEVTTDLQVKEKEATDSEGKAFTYKYIALNNEEYRVPNSVISALKVLLEENPNLKKVKVKKSGQGLNTQYQVIPLG